MDARNLFHTKSTYRIIRAEHLLVLVVTGGLMLLNAGSVNWLRAFIAFWVIDLVGYLPGMIAYRRSKTQVVNRWFHHAYNIAHTYLVTGTCVAIWAYFNGGFEWAMLAVPFHLSIDRGFFGNILKPVELSFEPRDHSDEVILAAMGRKPSNTRIAADVETLVEQDELNSVLDHPSGYLALSKRNTKFAVDGVKGFIAYREQGKHFWMFGGVHAAAADAETLLSAFLRFAEASDKRVAAVQVRAHQVDLFARHGFAVNQMGTTFAVALDGYSLAGSKKMQLRNKVNKARKDGLRVFELGKDVPVTETRKAQLKAISAEWLAEKKKPEIDFMVGELGDLSATERRTFIAVDLQDQAVGFISYVPVCGQDKPGYLHDLTRRTADAPAGTMELCNATAIERFQAEKVKFLHFGFTPFVVDEDAEPHANRWVHRLMQWIRKHGAKIYSTDSQVAYKTKWGADLTAREYLAVRPVSIRAAYDLLRLTKVV
jgi:lysylphosphatidylglycerol synthetase-like protein (DUF2156 family)